MCYPDIIWKLYLSGRINTTEFTDYMLRYYLHNINKTQKQTLIEKAIAYDTARENISTLLDRRFPWHNLNGLRIRVRYDDYGGFWCFYIAVPRRHVLFGVNYDMIPGLYATYSDFMATDKYWWEFGWDYYSPSVFIPRNLYICVETGKPPIDTVVNAEVLTAERVESDIRAAVNVLLDIHKSKTGAEYKANPGSSSRNSRNRERNRRRAKMAENSSAGY